MVKECAREGVRGGVYVFFNLEQKPRSTRKNSHLLFYFRMKLNMVKARTTEKKLA